jgi:hypothetical protein
MITLSMTSIVIHQAQAVIAPGQTKRTAAAAPPAITGDNIYVAWWTNKTGNDEVLFRASTDAGWR